MSGYWSDHISSIVMLLLSLELDELLSSDELLELDDPLPEEPDDAEEPDDVLVELVEVEEEK